MMTLNIVSSVGEFKLCMIVVVEFSRGREMVGSIMDRGIVVSKVEKE